MHALASQQIKRLVANLEVKMAAHVNAYEQWNQDLITNEAYNQVGMALAEARNDLITYIGNLERRACIGAALVETIRYAPNGIGAIQTIAVWDKHHKEHPL